MSVGLAKSVSRRGQTCFAQVCYTLDMKFIVKECITSLESAKTMFSLRETLYKVITYIWVYLYEEKICPF
ncbi:hypothetical protein SAMN05660830_00540 [Halodesulfovibrio aestuarii]|uniref:Uncharacterized protein n=1 Tax=Halodesulfovibrio aestuarii TaxID=126333 RepID=A0A8G2F6U5_9BACT|nr:hypothetical protein SAMN05660830_00540 [Halodesulfovibrio aestuarii]